jgi:hypothetical protein
MPNLSSVIVFVFTLAFVPLNPNPHGFVKPLKGIVSQKFDMLFLVPLDK